MRINQVMIRDAEVDDVVFIKDLVVSLSRYYLENDNAELPEWLSRTLLVTEFEHRILSPEFNNYVFYNDEIILGYISIKGDGHLYHLFVREEFQGQGIAKALWDHVLDRHTSDLDSVRSSIYAVPVYTRFGFKESGPSLSKDGIAFQPMKFTRNK